MEEAARRVSTGSADGSATMAARWERASWRRSPSRRAAQVAEKRARTSSEARRSGVLMRVRRVGAGMARAREGKSKLEAMRAWRKASGVAMGAEVTADAAADWAGRSVGAPEEAGWRVAVESTGRVYGF